MSNTEKNNIMTDRVSYYFKSQWNILLIITISGLVYNLGLLAGPWFEGRMTGCLVNILGGKSTFTDMLILVIFYVIAIAVVQISRYIKYLSCELSHPFSTIINIQDSFGKNVSSSFFLQLRSALMYKASI